MNMGYIRKTTKDRPTGNCASCGKSFVIPYGITKKKFCDVKCSGKMHEKRHGSDTKIPCLKCHASLLMTGAQSGRLLNWPKQRVSELRKKLGIKTLTNKEARVKALGYKAKWWGNNDTAADWMSEYNVKFPDWSNHIERKRFMTNKSMFIRYNTDMNFRIRHNLRCDIRSRVKRNDGRKAAKTEILLGCSIQEFRNHLENKFNKGMTWQNYGSQWEIDHIVPVSWFNLTKPEHQHRCWHYSNLRPLLKITNRKRGNRAHPQLLMTHLTDFAKH
jgi:hypothetical protein